jgi:hypothetical protein
MRTRRNAVVLLASAVAVVVIVPLLIVVDARDGQGLWTVVCPVTGETAYDSIPEPAPPWQTGEVTLRVGEERSLLVGLPPERYLPDVVGDAAVLRLRTQVFPLEERCGMVSDAYAYVVVTAARQGTVELRWPAAPHTSTVRIVDS